MHYTSIENIYKVIAPLFLDDLKKELDEIKERKRERNKKLLEFQKKLSSLKFLESQVQRIIKFSDCLAARKSKGENLFLGIHLIGRGCKYIIYEEDERCRKISSIA